MVDVDHGQPIRIHLGGGTILTITAAELLEFVKLEKRRKLPVVRPTSRKKSCPNPDCPGGWLPDRLKTGKRVCPLCKTEW